MIDFDKLEDHKDAFADADLAFVCLGTTRAKSGAEGFVKVDYDYIVNTANILKEHGRCKDYHLVSSTGRYNLISTLTYLAHTLSYFFYCKLD